MTTSCSTPLPSWPQTTSPASLLTSMGSSSSFAPRPPPPASPAPPSNCSTSARSTCSASSSTASVPPAWTTTITSSTKTTTRPTQLPPPAPNPKKPTAPKRERLVLHPLATQARAYRRGSPQKGARHRSLSPPHSLQTLHPTGPGLVHCSSLSLFARFDLAARLRTVHHARGVRGVVHFGHQWPQIPDAVIEDLRATVGADH